MRRHPGSKDKMSKNIIRYFPDVTGLNYYEPFAGVAYMYRRVIMNQLPFKSYYVSDHFEWAFNYLSALRGDLIYNGVDMIDQVEEFHNTLTPECAYENEIREIFERMKPLCRQGDPFAYLFLCTYANGQYVYPQRLDTASFHPQYLRGGISTLTREKALGWRWLLLQSQVKNTDAFELLPTLGENDFVYLDPPYVNNRNGKSTFRLYGVDFELKDHYRLAEILRAAKFKWCLSYGDRPLVLDLYKDFNFYWIYRGFKGTRSKYPSYGEWIITNF